MLSVTSVAREPDEPKRRLILSAFGGGRGIRTPEGLAALAVFKTAPINHSGIPPRRE